MHRLLFLPLLAVFLTACGPAPEELALQSQQAATAIAANWTETPTATPSPTATQTPTATFTVSPTPSPTPLAGGGKIAFGLSYSTEFGYSSSYFIMDTNGANVVQIYGDESLPEEEYLGWASPGVFSPDGKYLAFGARDTFLNSSGEYADSRLTIGIYNTWEDRIELVIEPENPWGDFGWSPSGEYFFYLEGVYHVPDWEHPIQFPAYYFQAMPTDDRLVVQPSDFSGGYQIIDLEGNIVNDMPDYHYGCIYTEESYQWCYSLIQQHDNNGELVSSSLMKWYFDGSDPEVLLELDAYVEIQLSPDKNLMLYFACPLTYDTAEESCRLGLIDLSTGEEIPVSNDSGSPLDPIFSPDSRYILYRSYERIEETETIRSWYTILEWETGMTYEVHPDFGAAVVGPPAWGP